MKFEKYISNRLGKGKQSENFTNSIVNIAIWGISLGVMVMILTLGIVNGFQSTVSDKVMNFNAHLLIHKISQADSYESSPISNSYNFIAHPGINSIKHIQAVATKAGIIKSKEDIHGIVLKGVQENYSWDYLENNLIAGEILSINDSSHVREAMISSTLAKIMDKGIGDKFTIYFITNKKNAAEGSMSQFQQRKYPFTIKGIYETGLSEDFDNRFILCDLHYIQKLNYWNEEIVGGFEIFLKNPSPSKIEQIIESEDKLAKSIDLISNNQDYLEEQKQSFIDENYEEVQQLRVETIVDRFPQIFDWLNLFDTHILIIIIIIIVISVINMSAVLLIQIIEKTSFIGILKSMGANSQTIKKIFLHQSLRFISKGLLYGNLLGIGLCLIQYYSQIAPLDAEIYYISYIPIKFDWVMIIMVNIITVISCLLILLIPSKVISKISPAKSIRFN